MKLINRLRAQAGLRTLLSDEGSNPKVAKNAAKLGVRTLVLHLAPGDMSGHEVCPKRSPGCSAACLHFAGTPAYQQAKNVARIKKTQLFFRDRDLFMNILALEIAASGADAIRLNGTSDIVWEIKRFNLYPEVKAIINREGETIIDLFPEVQFYDYTAIPGRQPPQNYHLTFSLKENNLQQALASGLNIAVVFEGELPATYLGRPVINDDEHDYRPADPTPCIVGLKVKGRLGRADESGFVLAA